jgi:signal transduction histidine kinase
LWQSVVVAGASAALMVGLDVAGRFDGAIVWLLAIAFTWSGTALLQSRLRLIGEIGERAAADERQRIARELHDVIAHTLAVTMLQLTGARLALERDPADAARALAEAERLGRQSLAELRKAVGLLAPGETQSFSALPTASDIPALVREVSDAGLVVRLDCDGDLASVPATAGLAMYRIVQESLANVARHAALAPAHVSINVENGHVCVDVRNPAPASLAAPSARDGHGLGLVVMRERAEALGGTLRAGLEGGEWRVNAVMPGASPA